MNARVELVEESNPLAHDALRLALQDVIGSPLFSRAPRTCKLLTYLVDMKCDGREADINEHAIGLAVFRRDARSYDTTLDPVVRVQMGRLRARLAEYAAAQTAPGARLSIPVGKYVPVLSQGDGSTSAPLPASLRFKRLQLTPLRNLSGAQDSTAFIAGVDEELGSKLFQTFGSLIQLPQQSLMWPVSGFDARHRLEGSIRVEKGHVRASMRLVDTRAGDIAWLGQFDRTGELCITMQEELADAICVQLRNHLAPIP